MKSALGVLSPFQHFIRFERTFHVLLEPDISHANNSLSLLP